MEDEMMNLIRVCILVVVSLTYCYFISSRIPKGSLRLISLLPIISLFTFLPLLLSSVLLQLYSGLLIAWLASFKLLLFAFARDDTLTINPSMSLLHFVILTALPVKIKRGEQTGSSKSFKSKIIISSLNPLMWCIMIQLYATRKQHALLSIPIVTYFLYSFKFYFATQFHFVFVGAIAKLLLGREIEDQFNEPYRSTSLQDFWGRRWNLMFSGVLKSTIHEPTRDLLTPLLGRRWALHPALVLTFVVSGLMHELVFFYVAREKPTWEVACYFLLHGVFVATEVEMKKRGWKLHTLVSMVLVAGIFCATSMLSFAELIERGEDEREIDEYIAFLSYLNIRSKINI